LLEKTPVSARKSEKKFSLFLLLIIDLQAFSGFCYSENGKIQRLQLTLMENASP